MHFGCFKGTAAAVFALSPNPKLDFETCIGKACCHLGKHDATVH